MRETPQNKIVSRETGKRYFMKKQEIKRAVDLISHYYSSANWYQRHSEIKDHIDKACTERKGAQALQWLMNDTGNDINIYRNEWGDEYAVCAKLSEDVFYIRWISTACHPWDEIAFELFKEVVDIKKELGYKVYSTNGTQTGMSEL